MTDQNPPSTTPSSLLSVRVSAEEKARLVRAANGRSLSAFARERLFGNADGDERRKELARCLAALGASGITKSLADLSEAVEAGSLAVDDEFRSDLSDALRDIRDLRVALMKALGLRGKGRS